MSRSIKFENAESFRVVFEVAERPWNPAHAEAYGPYVTIGIAKSAGKRESGNFGSHPGLTYRIQRTATDWQDVA